MQLLLLSYEEFSRRIGRVREQMKIGGIDAVLISENANLYYLTGRVFSGFVFLPAEGMPFFFVKRPVKMEGDGVVEIRKPEQIAETIVSDSPSVLGLELDLTPYSMVKRLAAIFPHVRIANASTAMRNARAVKTKQELDYIRRSGVKQTRVYSLIPSLYHEGMTDMELQVEIERTSRLEGCLGQFRISGNSMELYMASLLVGDNADNPTPYDFAMGGEGLDPSLPVGCNGTIIRSGNTIMADVNGNYTGYMTDMTRTFRLGDIPRIAEKAHQCSIDICHRLAKETRPGMEARRLYEIAMEMADESGLHDYFMGHSQKAGFIGHGVGIEINELPVIAPRSHDLLQENNVIALEPKFVIPNVGAVGIENTYTVTTDGLESLTMAPEKILNLIQNH